MEPKHATLPPHPRARAWQIFAMFIFALLVGFGIWYARSQRAQSVVSGVVSSPVDILSNESGRTNILLLGVGGEGHSGADLTDSMLLLSLPITGASSPTLIPIPRDIWVDSLSAKINTAYHYGEERGEGEGRNLVKQAVTSTLGVPIHYVLVLDFDGFVKAIDAVGGIEVDVKTTFDDYKYPIPGKETAEPESARYTHVHFDQGITHMDGETALRFARSRHALGDEGTDFARAKRQEQIILAFRDKVLSTQTLFSATALEDLKNSVISSIDTDITSREQASFVKVVIGMGDLSKVDSLELTPYLQNPPLSKKYGGQWVLIPSPNLSALQAYVQTSLAK